MGTNGFLYDNPFGQRMMIESEDDFIGREGEIRTICSYLKQRTPVSVVGERRIGKSSLLNNLVLTGNRRLGDLDRNRFRFFYLDMLSAEFSSPPGFVEMVLSKLKVEFNTEELEKFPSKALVRGLKKYKEQGVLPVLLIDEFEKLIERKEAFTNDFFENLRSCCGSRLVTYVTASQQNLKDLTQASGLSSPFWNIFHTEPLGLFTCDECLDFIEIYWKPFQISLEEKSFLLTYGGLHPLFLQIVAFHLLENRRNRLDDKELKEKIKQDFALAFRSPGEKFSDWLRQNVPRGLDSIDKAIDFLGKQVKNITQFFKHF